MEKSANFSPCRKYRYSLWRSWDKLGMTGGNYAMFIGLNPSTADEVNDDPTVRRCIAYAKAWGYGALCMTNIFGFRATDPKDMMAVDDPIGEGNNTALKEFAKGAGVVVAAWGVHGAYRGRGEEVRLMLPNLSCLRLTKDGHPGHPLYLPKSLGPTPWR